MDLYAKLQEAYGWLPDAIDRQDFLFLLDQIVLSAKIKYDEELREEAKKLARIF